MSRILVTGAAGFIGFHLVNRLVADGHEVVGIDNLNNYYDVSLKQARLDRLLGLPRFTFEKLDITDPERVQALFARHALEKVAHLAAQAGVRYSLENPRAYVDANLVGFINILEACRHASVEHLVYASSSSVYGANTKLPFSTSDNVDHPISIYAATKKANELMAHAYSHLYRLPTTGLRFFTVYGPWGRPDMALFIFTKAILAGNPIDVFNNGLMQRDFTYVDDIVEGVTRILDRVPTPAQEGATGGDPSSSTAPYRVYNIGNNNPAQLGDLITLLEEALGKPAIKRLRSMQPGDVPATYADVDPLARDVGFQPHTPLAVGVGRFVEWYRSFYS